MHLANQRSKTTSDENIHTLWIVPSDATKFKSILNKRSSVANILIKYYLRALKF